MNIEEAKTEIRRAVSIYLRKDAYGSYRIPIEKQRPIFMIGAPGIGKTAVMEQIARELDLALVAYSMTHHTRQSALGLPFIVHRTWRGQEFDVSEYTMSEIIASIYECMEKSGREEGILFLDEINCVSETLAPSMLQFLQYKTFGNHRVPEGWVIVTAGNPPEYNRSVREFDVVTLDRLKVLPVEPDYEAWKRYAGERGLHRAVTTYLDIRREDFYSIESGAEGKTYVTARGWEDLAEAISLYEESGFPVDERLVRQYLRAPRIAGEFATYYELFAKYRADYGIFDILNGTEPQEIDERAAEAAFDERLTVTGLLTGALVPEMAACAEEEEALKQLLGRLKEIRGQVEREPEVHEETAPTEESPDVREEPASADVSDLLREIADDAARELARRDAEYGLGVKERRALQYPMSFAEELRKKIYLAGVSGMEAFELVRGEYAKRVQAMKERTAETEKHIENLFAFAERNFGDGSEMLVIVTELTVNQGAAAFLAAHESEAYFRYQKKFMLYERSRELAEKLRGIEGQ